MVMEKKLITLVSNTLAMEATCPFVMDSTVGGMQAPHLN